MSIEQKNKDILKIFFFQCFILLMIRKSFSESSYRISWPMTWGLHFELAVYCYTQEPGSHRRSHTES